MVGTYDNENPRLIDTESLERCFYSIKKGLKMYFTKMVAIPNIKLVAFILVFIRYLIKFTSKL